MTVSKYGSVITAALLAVISAACLGIFAIERQRFNLEARDHEERVQADQEAELYQAWLRASRWDSVRMPLVNSSQEPKRPSELSDRSVWVKSFQRSDVRLSGRSKKYGNASYAVNFVIGFHDRASASFAEYLSKHAKPEALDAAVVGQWRFLNVQCGAEKMDGPADWAVADYTFTPVSSKPDLPLQKLKSDD